MTVGDPSQARNILRLPYRIEDSGRMQMGLETRVDHESQCGSPPSWPEFGFCDDDGSLGVADFVEALNHEFSHIAERPAPRIGAMRMNWAKACDPLAIASKASA